MGMDGTKWDGSWPFKLGRVGTVKIGRIGPCVMVYGNKMRRHKMDPSGAEWFGRKQNGERLDVQIWMRENGTGEWKQKVWD